MIRVPRSLRELAVAAQRMEAQMAGNLERRPTVAELARATSATEDAVRDALRALDARSPDLLDGRLALADDDGDTLGERLGAEQGGYRRAEHRAPWLDCSHACPTGSARRSACGSRTAPRSARSASASA
jgi:RNA polymerase sigma-B factor